MRSRILSFVFACVGFLSCQNEHSLKPVQPRTGENFTFFKSASLYGDALKKRSTSFSAAFEIKKAETLKNGGASGHDYLIITVEHGIDCDGDFELIWDGAIMESYPPQANIALRYHATCNGGAPQQESVLSLDLDEFIGDADLVDNAVFHIINASKIVSDADIAIQPNSSN